MSRARGPAGRATIPEARPVTVHPKYPKDLMLAPVAVEIDQNLSRMRDRPPQDVVAKLELELDRPAVSGDREERAGLVLRQALRHVDLHGWSAAITSDGSRLHLDGGSVSLDLGLSPGITRYIQNGDSD
jgi:hypothetical protein